MNAAPHAPAGWDCHAHLFGPYDRFPLAPERSYTPPEAVAPQYLALLAHLGLGHGVLVHPSAYGEDHALLLHALAAHDNLRGVVVVQPGSRLALSGLHAELWTDIQALPGIAAELKALPVPVVIDHMGGFDVEAGIDALGFRVLLELLASGRTWVKLCAYRNLLNAPDWQAGRAFQQKMVETNPERLVWVSDWPHLRVAPAPDTAALLAMFKDWTGNEEAARQVLEANPAVLYR